MDALMTAVVLWLSVNFGLPATHTPPRIEFASSHEMALLRKKTLQGLRTRETAMLANRGSQRQPVSDLVAFYNDHTKTIYLPAGWTGETPAELAILVHEVVHHLQNVAAVTYECPSAREKIAYRAQERWLGLFGRSLETDFGIDRTTLFVKTSCGFGMIDPP
jgi:hypothetical protein